MHELVTINTDRINARFNYETLIVIPYVRIGSWEVNAVFSTVSTEQSNLRNNLSLFLYLYYPIFMKVIFFFKYKDFLSEEYRLFPHNMQCSNCATCIK